MIIFIVVRVLVFRGMMVIDSDFFILENADKVLVVFNYFIQRDSICETVNRAYTISD
jgi:hypothetical protein